VGGGGQSAGEDLLRVYKVPEVGADPLTAEQMEASFALPAQGEAVGEGDFYAIAVSDRHVYVSCNGDDDKNWIARAEIVDKKLADFQRFIPTGESLNSGPVTGMAISPQGLLAVALIGTMDRKGDSMLAFYNQNGEVLEDQFPTELNDISALAYSPGRKLLYALDLSWRDPRVGGLYKLIASDSLAGCQPFEMAKLDKPTAMAFDREGNLYVTIIGTDEFVTASQDPAANSFFPRVPSLGNSADTTDDQFDQPAEDDARKQSSTSPKVKHGGKLLMIKGLDESRPPRRSRSD
jgi:hypothetical protein